MTKVPTAVGTYVTLLAFMFFVGVVTVSRCVSVRASAECLQVMHIGCIVKVLK